MAGGLNMHTRPYIGSVSPKIWNDLTTGEQTPGVLVIGLSGMAAHLNKSECYKLANDLVDAADQLPEPLVPKPCYASPSDRLTAADGTTEEPLPATIAE